MLHTLSRWFHSDSPSSPRKRTRNTSPTVIHVEDRVLLAALTWTGEGSEGSFTDPDNWAGDEDNVGLQEGDDVTVGGAGILRITSVAGAPRLNSLTFNRELEFAGADNSLIQADTITFNAHASLDEGIISGETVTFNDSMFIGHARVVGVDVTLRDGIVGDTTLDPQFGPDNDSGVQGTRVTVIGDVETTGLLNVSGTQTLEVQGDVFMEEGNGASFGGGNVTVTGELDVNQVTLESTGLFLVQETLTLNGGAGYFTDLTVTGDLNLTEAFEFEISLGLEVRGNTMLNQSDLEVADNGESIFHGTVDSIAPFFDGGFGLEFFNVGGTSTFMDNVTIRKGVITGLGTAHFQKNLSLLGSEEGFFQDVTVDGDLNVEMAAQNTLEVNELTMTGEAADLFSRFRFDGADTTLVIGQVTLQAGSGMALGTGSMRDAEGLVAGINVLNGAFFQTIDSSKGDLRSLQGASITNEGIILIDHSVNLRDFFLINRANGFAEFSNNTYEANDDTQVFNEGALRFETPESLLENNFLVEMEIFNMGTVTTTDGFGVVEFTNFIMEQAASGFQPVFQVADGSFVLFSDLLKIQSRQAGDTTEARFRSNTTGEIFSGNYTIEATDFSIDAGQQAFFSHLTMNFDSSTESGDRRINLNGELIVEHRLNYDNGLFEGTGRLVIDDGVTMAVDPQIGERRGFGPDISVDNFGTIVLNDVVTLRGDATIFNEGVVEFRAGKTNGGFVIGPGNLLFAEGGDSFLVTGLTLEAGGTLFLENTNLALHRPADLDGDIQHLGEVDDPESPPTLEFRSHSVIHPGNLFDNRINFRVDLFGSLSTPENNLTPLAIPNLIANGDVIAPGGLIIEESLLWLDGEISVRIGGLTIQEGAQALVDNTFAGIVLIGDLLNQGTVRLTNSSSILMAASLSTIENSGSLVLGSRTALYTLLTDPELIPKLVNTETGTMTYTGIAEISTGIINLYFTNQGIFRVERGDLRLDRFFHQNGQNGDTFVDTDAGIVMNKDVEPENFGLVDEGFFRLYGDFMGNLAVEQNGGLVVDDNVTTVLDGNLFLTDTATTYLQLTQPVRPAEPFLVVTEIATIAGELLVQPMDGVTTSIGDRMGSIQATTRLGRFRNVAPIDPDPGKVYTQRIIRNTPTVVVKGVDSIKGRRNNEIFLSQSDSTSFSNTRIGEWNETGLMQYLSGDFNGDGFTDAAALRDNGDWLVKLQNRETGLLDDATVWTNWENSNGFTIFKVIDANGDGFDDIIGWNNGEWRVSTSDGSDSFDTSTWSRWSSGAGWQNHVYGDFNADGRTDVAARSAAGNWWVGISDGDSYRTSHWGSWSRNAGWRDVQMLDTNGDGRTDIAGRTASGNWWVSLSTGTRFEAHYFGAWNPNAGWVDVLVLDVNNDGRDDIAGRTASGNWWVAVSDSEEDQFTSRLWGAWSPNTTWNNVLIADVNADGFADIVGRNTSGNWWVELSNGEDRFLTRHWGSWSESLTWEDAEAGQYA